MSKYEPLINYLRKQTSYEVRLSFADIEQIIDDTLPKSARIYDAWWANSCTKDSHTWSHKWQEAGWKKVHINRRKEFVVFRRIGGDRRVEYFDIENSEAYEGYKRDRKILARRRNATLAVQRKKRDDYKCQACGFRLEVRGKFVIEVHHCDPLADTGKTMTSIEQLVSLCPTCHRIAHLRSTPYGIEEIRELRSYERNDA